MTRVLKWLIYAVLGFFGLLVILQFVVPLIEAPVIFGFYLAFGWIGFLIHTLPQVRMDGSAFGFSLLTLILLAGGLHGLLRSWFRAVEPASGDSPSSPSSQTAWRLRWTVAITACLVVAFAAGICAVGIAHQTAWMATSPEPNLRFESRMAEAVRRTQSRNNLKNIGMALNQFVSDKGTLPPDNKVPVFVQSQHGWQTFLLPHIDQVPLFNQVQFEKPWAHSANKRVFSEKIGIYLNPASDKVEDARGYALSHYSGNEYVLGRRGLALSDISDGLANTLLAGEVKDNPVPWGHHANRRDPALGINASPQGFGGPWTGGCNFLMADGSTRFVNENISRDVLKALSTPNGRESVSQDW